MYFLINLCLCAFSISLLAAISLSSKRINEFGSLNSRLIMGFLHVTIFLLVADLLSRFEGRTEDIYYLFNAAGNFLVFLFGPVLPILWLMYVHNQIFSDDKETLRIFKPFIFFILLNASLTVASLFTGWYYYIDANNIYHRGELFLFPYIVDQTILLSVFVLLFANRKRIDKSYYYSLLFFGVPPLICILLQVFIYGIAFALNGIAMSIIIMYINTQNRRMNVDYLTGAFNRNQLDHYIADKIRKCTDSKSFSAILMDLDDFKSINDNFGHGVGDDALKTLVQILRKCTRKSDFIARFGGDEFYIIMDISEMSTLSEVVDRIKKSLEEFNERKEKQYELSLSIGYMIYDVNEKSDVAGFESQIDKLMYSDKLSCKS